MLVPRVRVVAEVEGAPVASCGRAVGGNGWTRQDRGRHNDTSGDLICRWLEINLSGYNTPKFLFWVVIINQ